MRQPVRTASLLAQPLDAVLGTPAGVRILRVLSRHATPLTPPEIAQRAGLTPEAVRRTLERLGYLGIVLATGNRRLAYTLNTTYPLVTALTSAFAMEEQRMRELLELVRTTVHRFRPAPRAVWMYGSVARGTDTPASDVDLAIIGPRPSVQRQALRLREVLEPFGRTHQIRPSVIVLTPDAVQRMSRERVTFWRNLARDAVVLYGVSPQEIL